MLQPGNHFGYRRDYGVVVARMSHSHPTYAEATKEACLAATENRAIHL